MTKAEAEVTAVTQPISRSRTAFESVFGMSVDTYGMLSSVDHDLDLI